VVAENIRHFFDQSKNWDMVKQLLKQGVNWPVNAGSGQQQSQFLTGRTYVITGTLEGLSRDQAAARLKAHGAKVSASVSAKTSAVISGENPGSKVAKAEALGVEILDQAGFDLLLGGSNDI
jgi:DNA ligase (NAD+)